MRFKQGSQERDTRSHDAEQKEIALYIRNALGRRDPTSRTGCSEGQVAANCRGWPACAGFLARSLRGSSFSPQTLARAEQRRATDAPSEIPCDPM